MKSDSRGTLRGEASSSRAPAMPLRDGKLGGRQAAQASGQDNSSTPLDDMCGPPSSQRTAVRIFNCECRDMPRRSLVLTRIPDDLPQQVVAQRENPG